MADSTEAKQKEGQKPGVKPSRKRTVQKQLVSDRRDAPTSELAEERAKGRGTWEQRPAVSSVSREAAPRAATESRFAHDFSRIKTHTEIKSGSINRRFRGFAADSLGALGTLTSEPEPAVQRHPPGATLLGGSATAPGDGGGGGGGGQSAPEPAGAAVEGGGQSPTGAPGATLAPGAASQTAGGASPSGAAVQEAGGSGGAAEPVAVSMPTLQTAYAQNALQTAFGGVAGRTMITGTIHIVANNAALLAEYDAIQIRNNVTNRDTNAVWVAGDKARWNTARNFRTNAFAYSGEIWIDATQTDPTATVHEMLHVNTASGFLGTAGRAINEGITQRLAVKAVKATGQSVAGSENTYQSEQGIVAKLIGVVGEGVVQNAYFNDPGMLVTAYETLMGSRSFAILKRTLNDTAEGYTAAGRILAPPSTRQKLAAINALLDWWVSDDDLTIIDSIVSTCSAEEKAKIAKAIQPRIVSLGNLGQRIRLRITLGAY